jgi:uroporphyrinogen-III decarboxylase
MNYRKLFQEIMNYRQFDRMPVIHWHGWDETHERWYAEGYPKDCNDHEYFDTVPMWTSFGANLYLFPEFEEKTIKETEDYRIFSDTSGVICKDWKKKSCIPHYIDFILKEAKDWPQFKERLQPDPARIPDDIKQRISDADNSGLPVLVDVASMMGWIRNWMGVENMSYLMYDDPKVYADMVNTLADLTCWSLDEILPIAKSQGVVPDMGFGWEDICGKTGPLVSPSIFNQCVAQGYRKIRDKLESHGVHLLGLDSDGMVEPLVPAWMDAGVNVFFPIEPGTWGATPEHMRKRFGKEIRFIGGFNKLVLEKDFAAIDLEFDSHIGLMKEGGFIIMPDHLITPGTPLKNYKYYLDRLRQLRF